MAPLIASQFTPPICSWLERTSRCFFTQRTSRCDTILRTTPEVLLRLLRLACCGVSSAPPLPSAARIRAGQLLNSEAPPADEFYPGEGPPGQRSR